ncbi:MAG: MBL fold metallo-hydrolase [Bacteroidota bacterium]
MSINIRTNGRGNAWPVPLGQEHPFYDKSKFEDLANASFSIIESNKDKSINKELLIDAGHGAIQYLIKFNNRIPDAIFLTHPHIDHTLSIDWVVQSYRRQYNKKYPVYASPLCWEQTLEAFPQLEKLVEFKPLLAGKLCKIDEFPGMKVIFYPVFHGESAAGAGMLLFEYEKGQKALFTGDILLPLLRKRDFEYLQNCDVVYTDANNRYPYPNSNHWSVYRPELIGEKKSELLSGWLKSKGNNINWFIRPNLPIKFNKTIHGYFEEFLKEKFNGQGLVLSVFDFSNKINAKNIHLVHYSGSEDFKYYKKNILDTDELQSWVDEAATILKLKSKFIVPSVGDMFEWV